MPIPVSELDLPRIDHTDPELRGERYRAAMAALRGHDGWLAAQPFGYLVLDRESGEFFLRTRAAVFPALTIAGLFQISDGPLHDEITRNVIALDGRDHGRLRKLVNPALAPRRVDRYRPAMREFLGELLRSAGEHGHIEFIESFAKPYPSLVIAHVMGAPLEDAERLWNWSSWIQRQFDPASLMSDGAEIEQAVGDCYAYIDEPIEHRGVAFPAGTVVLVSAWHANRDGVEPDAFDIDADRAGRAPTFGAGIHYCAGANLARAEPQEAVSFLARSVRSVELDGEPRFGTPSGIYGIDALPLVLERA